MRNYLEKLSLGILGLSFFFFPLVFTNLTTEFYVLPKQALIAVATLILLAILALRMLSEKVVRIRRTPFDFPIILFVGALLLSGAFAVNKVDSFLSSIPLIFAILLYFLTLNFVREKRSVTFLFVSFLSGASLVALSAVLSYFKIHLLPFDFTKSQTFTPLGSQLDQGIYLILAFAATLYLLIPNLKNLRKRKLDLLNVAFLVDALIIAAGLATTIFILVKLQRPTILPYYVGFQTAFAAISQDIGRPIQSFLFGSGFGTYINVFTRFKTAAYNLDPNLWSLTFLRSSSFVLEILATTGLAGVLSFGFLSLKLVKRRVLFWPVVLGVVLMLVLPFSFTNQALFFLILALFAANEGTTSNKYYDVELALVTLQKGFFSFQGAPRGLSKILPFIFALVLLVAVSVLAFFSTRYVLANAMFQKSFAAVANNNGTQAYNDQSKALTLVPYSDAYQRSFSQTNLALANSLANSTPQGASPSAETQQTILTLVQQSINAGRTATTISPQTSLNWQNLSSIYRALIGFGKNADSFAILANQQAIVLDPNNPQQYINLGGLYYQLAIWDKAEEQFKTAINLKPDFANAYYNLAHTYEQKGDLEKALEQLEIVKTLVKNDKDNLAKVEAEIAIIKQGLDTGANIGEPETLLPPQTPPIEIPAPEATVSAQ